MAGASKNINSFKISDPEVIFEEYNSKNFKEIYSMKLIKSDRFLVISGDAHLLEILNLKSFELFKIFNVCTDICLFKFIGKKLYFYDDESYTTIIVTI